jgi:hypothetical protein
MNGTSWDRQISAQSAATSSNRASGIFFFAQLHHADAAGDGLAQESL